MLAALLLAAACSPREAIPEAPDYASAESWYVTDRGADVDLFYISSTETFDATVGRKVFHYAQAADSAACPGMRGEMEGVDRILSGGLNFYSPFYRQMSMETYQDMDLIDSRFPLAMDDVRRAFKYYVEELSDGRPFVLAGFSQGGEVLVELLKELPDSLQDRLVAAYVLGWKITPEDLAASSAIRPAQGADDTGVTICYNSVDSPENASFVSSGNTVAINPVNWCTDATPAVLFDSLTVTLDPETKLLLVDGFEGTGYAWKPYFKDGCYHTFEIRWYGGDPLVRGIPTGEHRRALRRLPGRPYERQSALRRLVCGPGGGRFRPGVLDLSHVFASLRGAAVHGRFLVEGPGALDQARQGAVEGQHILALAGPLGAFRGP